MSIFAKPQRRKEILKSNIYIYIYIYIYITTGPKIFKYLKRLCQITFVTIIITLPIN